jgi:hypothetical protein
VKTAVKWKVRDKRDSSRKEGGTGERTKGGARERERGRWYGRRGHRCGMTSSSIVVPVVWNRGIAALEVGGEVGSGEGDGLGAREEGDHDNDGERGAFVGSGEEKGGGGGGGNNKVCLCVWVEEWGGVGARERGGER